MKRMKRVIQRMVPN